MLAPHAGCGELESNPNAVTVGVLVCRPRNKFDKSAFASRRRGHCLMRFPSVIYLRDTTLARTCPVTRLTIQCRVRRENKIQESKQMKRIATISMYVFQQRCTEPRRKKGQIHSGTTTGQAPLDSCSTNPSYRCVPTIGLGSDG